MISEAAGIVQLGMASLFPEVTPHADANISFLKTTTKPQNNSSEHINRQIASTKLSKHHKERFSSSSNIQSTHSQKLISKTNILSEKMSAPPAVTAHILRNFSIAFIGIVGTVAAGTEVYNIASRKHRELTKGWGERRQYNTQPQPQQDRLYESLSEIQSMSY